VFKGQNLSENLQETCSVKLILITFNKSSNCHLNFKTLCEKSKKELRARTDKKRSCEKTVLRYMLYQSWVTRWWTKTKN